MYRLRTASVLLSLFLIGCADRPATPLAPEAVVGSLTEARRNVRFVHRAPNAPQFSTETVVLEAVAGVAGSAELRFRDGSPFAKLELAPESLVGAVLDGREIQAGEVVRITLRTQDASRFFVRMEPAGLLFNPESPAQVTFDYTLANDVDLGLRFEVRKQHAVGEQWLDVKEEHDPKNRQVRGRVDDFTVYALAYP